MKLEAIKTYQGWQVQVSEEAVFESKEKVINHVKNLGMDIVINSEQVVIAERLVSNEVEAVNNPSEPKTSQCC